VVSRPAFKPKPWSGGRLRHMIRQLSVQPRGLMDRELKEAGVSVHTRAYLNLRERYLPKGAQMVEIAKRSVQVWQHISEDLNRRNSRGQLLRRGAVRGRGQKATTRREALEIEAAEHRKRQSERDKAAHRASVEAAEAAQARRRRAQAGEGDSATARRGGRLVRFAGPPTKPRGKMFK
jgi:hypothetical protein